MPGCAGDGVEKNQLAAECLVSPGLRSDLLQSRLQCKTNYSPYADVLSYKSCMPNRMRARIRAAMRRALA